MPARRATRPRRLKPRHEKLLAERAIDPEIAALRGYWTVESADEFRQLGWSSKGRKAPPRWMRPPGLAIPLYSTVDLVGLGDEQSIYAQFRPDRPVRDQEGRVRKYVNPTGSQAVIDVNPIAIESELWSNRDVPLFIVEGVPKGDSCWSAGLPAVSIQGVWNFTSEDEEGYRELLPDLRYLPVAGREVVIAFDADAWTNSDVRAAARELGRVLSRGKGGASKVSALRLPDPKKKTGIDDFLARGGGKESVLDLLCDLEELAVEEQRDYLTALSQVQAEPPTCLWEPYLLRDTLCFLDGAPAVGKTFIALELCAAITRGRKMPMGWREDGDLGSVQVPKGNVVYLTQENSAAKSLRPRFDRLKGDPSKFFIKALGGDAGDDFTLHDLTQLGQMIKQVDPVLVVLDPIMNFMGEQTDAHRDNEVRPMLSRLMLMAEQTNTTILGIRHLRKAATGTAVYAAGGSVAFSGAARSILIASKYVKDGEGEVTVLAHAKASDTPTGKSLEYEVKSQGKDEAGFYLVDFTWKGGVDVGADDLVGGQPSGGNGESKADQAQRLLTQLLKAEPDGVPASVILQAAESMGIGETTLRRISKDIEVAKERVGGTGKKGHWVWKLPAVPTRKKPANSKDEKKF